MIEDLNLKNCLELALERNDSKSFELLFNFCYINGNSSLVCKVVMRNLQSIMDKQELDKPMSKFF